MKRAACLPVIVSLSILMSFAPAHAIVIETGNYSLGDYVSGTANIDLGPGKYRFTLSISAPVLGFDPGSNAAVKTLSTEFYCTDPGNPLDPPFHCGGSDVPQDYLLQPIGPNIYGTFVEVLAPYVTGPSAGGTYFHESEICCEIRYGFEPLADGSYTIAYTLVPEAAGWAMMASGFGGIGLMMRRRRAMARRIAA